MRAVTGLWVCLLASLGESADGTCGAANCGARITETPLRIYVSASASGASLGTAEQPYLSLFQALTAPLVPAAEVLLLRGTHMLVPTAPIAVTTEVLLSSAVALRTLFCDEEAHAECATEAASVQLQSYFTKLAVRVSLEIKSVVFSGEFSLKAGCTTCTYCPSLRLVSGVLVDDRGTAVTVAAEQTLCDAYADAVFLDVGPSAVLTLTSVRFQHFRQQLHALIVSTCGAVSLTDVTFSEIVPRKQGLLGGVVLHKGTSYSLELCGSFNFSGGKVELINNGYEFSADDTTFSGFARLDNVLSVKVDSVVLQNNFLARALIYFRRVLQLQVTNCVFAGNVVTEAPLYVNSNLTLTASQQQLTHITVEDSQFLSNFGVLSGALFLSYSRDHLNTAVRNCSFAQNFARTYGVLDFRNIFYASSTQLISSQQHWVLLSALNFTQNSAPTILFFNTTENVMVVNLTLADNGDGIVAGETAVVGQYAALADTYAQVTPAGSAAECQAIVTALDVWNLTLADSTLKSSSCQSGPTGLRLLSNTTANVTRVTLRDNVGPSAVYASLVNNLTLVEVTFANNSNQVSLQPACLLVEQLVPTRVNLVGCVFQSNLAISSTVAWVTGARFLNIRDCAVLNNVAETSCAGVAFMPLLTGVSSFEVRNSRFENNSAQSATTLLVSTNGYQMLYEDQPLSLRVSNCTFVNNSAIYHGASITTLDFVFISANSSVANCTFLGNSGSEGGGGIYAEFALGKLTVSNSLFSRNAGRSGAAIHHRYMGAVSGRGLLYVVLSTFTYNNGDSVIKVEGIQRSQYFSENCTFAFNLGSCVMGTNGDLGDVYTVFANNSAEKGAALRFESSKVQISFGIYYGNVAASNGGVLYSSAASSLYCNSCDVFKNFAAQTGGAVYLDQDSTFMGVSIIFRNNQAGDRGSVLYSHRSTVSLTNVTFRDNTAGNYGTLFFSASVFTMNSCDMSSNLAKARSPGICCTLSTITISNCKFHDQVGPKGGSFFLTDQSTGTVRFSEFWNNTSGSGGAFVVIALSTMTIEDTKMRDCSATTDGGLLTSRISTITFTRVSVQNIVSSLTFGAIFLLQSTLIVSDSTFTDLKGSGAYALATAVTVTRTSMARVYAGLGAAINCAECSSLIVTDSNFTQGTAKVGGVISSYTKGTSANVLVSAFTNNRFESNRAVNGGAIYSDSMYLNLTKNVFVNNSASSQHYASSEMLLKGLGGAVYSVCSSISYCRFIYVNNTFGDNNAEVAGGGLYWADSFPVINGTLGFDNLAVYGNDVASFAVRLAALGASDSVEDYLLLDDYPLVSILSDVGSGHVYSGTLRLALIDQYGSIVSTDYVSSAQMLAPNTSDVTVSGNTQVVAVQGTFEFTNFTFIGPPLSNQSVFITTNGVDNEKKITSQDPSTYYSTVSLEVRFRDCKVGESLQGNECRPCPVNTFSLSPSEPCMSCPSHLTCYGTYLMVPDKGFWRPDAMQNLVFACLNAEACLGSPDSGDLSLTGQCAEGYEGNLCSACKSGYSSQGNGVCSRCPSVTSNIILSCFLALFVVCLFVIVVIIALRGALRPRSELAIYLKILLNYLQMIMVASSLNLSWPNYVEKFLRGQQVAGNAADQLLSVECLLKEFFTQEVYFTNLGVYAVMPAVTMGLCLLFWLLVKACWHVEHTSQKLIASLVLVVFVLHTSLTKVMFSAFTCRELLPSQFWLASNLSIRCWNERHVRYLLMIALPGILVWVVGLPTVCLIRLVSAKRMLAEPLLRLQFSFLFKGYRAEWYFWEFVILYRKIVIVCTSVFLTTVSIVVQALSMLAVVLVCLFLQLYVKPFIGGSFNLLELKALLASLLTIYAGLYFQTNSTQFGVDVVIFAVIILANAYFLLGWARLVIPIVIATLRERLTLLRRYQVHPTTMKTSKDVSISSKLPIGEVTPSSFVLPESFEAPNNTSFLGAVTPVNEEMQEER